MGVPATRTKLVLGVLVLAAGVGGFTNGEIQHVQAFTTTSEIVWQVSLVVVPLIAIASRGHEYVEALERSKLLLLLPVVAAASSIWSYSPEDTLWAALRLGAAIIWCVAILTLLRALTWQVMGVTCALLAAVSIVLILADAAAYDMLAGGARGIFPQKNSLGRIAAAGVLLALFASRSRRQRLLLAVPSITALAVSKSTTAMVEIAVSLLVVLMVKLRDRRSPWYPTLAFSAMLAFLAILISHAWQNLYELFGKTATLSGRTDIWGNVVPYFFEEPVFGYGYAAFWPWRVDSLHRESAAVQITNAHNAWLDTALGLGLVGIVFLALIFLLLSRRIFSRPALPLKRSVFIGPALIAYLFVQTLTESSVLEPRTIGLFIVSVLFVGRDHE